MINTAESVLADIIKKRKMTIRYVSEQAGIRYQRLQRCLCGRGQMRADEFIDICRFLDLDPLAIGHSCQVDQDYTV